MPLPIIVGGTFRVEKKLGEGSFGAVYLGIDIGTSVEVAIKLEAKKTPADYSTLAQESLIYRALAGTTAVPHMHWYGSIKRHNALVMDRLGQSLEDAFNRCGRKFSLKTVLMLADQMISQIEAVHSRHIIHRDIKPDNFIMGYGTTSNRVFVIDFGLSKYYCNPKTKKHNKMRTGKGFCGTARYASINAHQGLEQGRRDDLEAVGYVLLYLLRGGLPWQGIKIKNATERYAETGRRKLATSTSSLCSGFPKEFSTYLDLTRKLRFEERPNYKAYRKLFMDLYTREGYMEDDIFDWTNMPAPSSGKLTLGAAAKPTAEVKVKVIRKVEIAEIVQGVDLVVKPHEATRAKNEANGQPEPVKSGLAAKEKVASKTKVVPEKMKPTANEPESKTRPKVLNKIAITTPALAKPNAKPLVVKPALVTSPPRLTAKVEPKAKIAPKPNLRKVERVPVCQPPNVSTPSPQVDMDEVLEKMGDLKISEKRPSMQRDTKVPGPRHVCSSNRKVQAHKSTPSPPLATRPTVIKPLGQEKVGPTLQPSKPLPAVKESLSPETIETSSDWDDVKPTKPVAVPTRRIPLRMRNVNSKPVAAHISSPPQRRKNPPRFANVNTNAKSPPRRRVMVTRAAAGRKEG